tara:strand:+ start:2967 stop:3332 length:366 start_codon:yes stop_codon:yes gene_type:complete
MDLELYPKNNAPQIEGYGKGYIKVLGNKIYTSILFLPDKYIELNKTSNEDNFTIITNNIKELNLELLIYGSLKGLGYESEMLIFLKTFNIPIEVMQIGSACRTWSVLIGDGRSITAIIDPA